MISLQDAGGYIFIYSDGKDIGTIKYASSWHSEVGPLKKDEVYSAMMNLAPRYRNRGIGTEVYKVFIGMMKRKGIRRILAVPESIDSERFMRRLGFREIKPNDPIENDVMELRI